MTYNNNNNNNIFVENAYNLILGGKHLVTGIARIKSALDVAFLTEQAGKRFYENPKTNYSSSSRVIDLASSNLFLKTTLSRPTWKRLEIITKITL